MVLGVLTSFGISVPVAGGGTPLKHGLSFLCELSPQNLLIFPFPNTWTHVLIHPKSFWTFCGLCLETLNVFLDSRHSTVATANHPEKLSSSGRGVNNGTTTAPGAEPAPALNGEHTQVWYQLSTSTFTRGLRAVWPKSRINFRVEKSFWLWGYFL